MKGKVVVGLDGSDTDFNALGNSGGEKTHKLSIAEMPSHQHDMGDDVYGGYTNQMGVRGDGGGGTHSTPQYSQTDAHSKYMPMPTGGSQAHNNLQPYTVSNYIIKAFQSVGVVAQVVQTETTNSTDVYSCEYINNKLSNLPTTGVTHLLDGTNDGSLRSSGSLEEDDEYTLGYDAVALGSETKASGWASHAEGGKCKATAQAAHAEGYYCEASGLYSHAEGWRTTAAGEYQHVQGKFNITDETLASIVGNGTAYNKLSNIHTLD